MRKKSRTTTPRPVVLEPEPVAPTPKPEPNPLAAVHQQLAEAKVQKKFLRPSEAPAVKAAIREGRLDLNAELTVSLGNGGIVCLRPRDVLQCERDQYGGVSDSFHKRLAPPLTQLAPHFREDKMLAARVDHNLAFGKVADAALEFCKHNVTAHVVEDRELIGAVRKHLGSVSAPRSGLMPLQDGKYLGWFTQEQLQSKALQALMADLATP